MADTPDKTKESPVLAVFPCGLFTASPGVARCLHRAAGTSAASDVNVLPVLPVARLPTSALVPGAQWPARCAMQARAVARRCGGAAGARCGANSRGGSTLGRAATPAELFRTRIKATELEAERLQQEAAVSRWTANLETEPADFPVDAAARAPNVPGLRGGGGPRPFTPGAVEILIAGQPPPSVRQTPSVAARGRVMLDRGYADPA